MNPLDIASQNDKCVVCRVNKFMIDQLREIVKEIRQKSKTKNYFLKRQLNDQNTEIDSLKNKLSHLKESINYLKGFIINQTGENSYYQGSGIKSQQEPSFNQF